jgi:hypothetical protein
VKARSLTSNKGCVTLVYIETYLKAKEELWKLKYFTMQKYNLQKILSNKTQNPSKCYNPITNLKFLHKPKYHLQKSLYQNRPITYYQNPLSYYTL